MDKEGINHRTTMNSWCARDMRDRRYNYDVDKRREQRLEKHECKVCFYLKSRIGGAAITKKSCNVCGNAVVHATTCTGVACKECAEALHICTHCGGDLDGRTR